MSDENNIQFGIDADLSQLSSSLKEATAMMKQMTNIMVASFGKMTKEIMKNSNDVGASVGNIKEQAEKLTTAFGNIKIDTATFNALATAGAKGQKSLAELAKMYKTTQTVIKKARLIPKDFYDAYASKNTIVNLEQITEAYKKHQQDKKTILEAMADVEKQAAEEAVKKVKIAEKNKLNVIMEMAEKRVALAEKLKRAESGKTDLGYAMFGKTDASKVSTAKANNNLQNITRQLTEKQVIANKKLEKSLNDIKKATGKVSTGLKGLNSKVKTSTSLIQKMGKTLQTTLRYVLAYRAINLVSTSVGEGFGFVLEIEKVQKQFEVLIKNTTVSKKLFSSLTTYAKDTTYEINNVTNAAKILLTTGLSSKKILPLLKQLGDVAMGNNEKFEKLAYAFSKTASRGRITMEEMRSFVRNGIPLLGELSKVIGISTSRVYALIKQGKVGFSSVEKALASLTAEGGRFHGMTDEMADSLYGILNRLKENTKIAAGYIINLLVPSMKEYLLILLKSVDATGDWAKDLSETIKVSNEFIGNLKAITIGFIALGTAIALTNRGSLLKFIRYLGLIPAKISKILFSLSLWSKHLLVFASFNSWVTGAVVALTLLTGAYAYFNNQSKKAEQRMKDVSEAAEQQVSKVSDLVDVVVLLSSVKEKTKEQQENLAKALKELTQLYPKYSDRIKEEIKLNGKLSESLVKLMVNRTMEAKVKMLEDNRTALLDKQAKLGKSKFQWAYFIKKQSADVIKNLIDANKQLEKVVEDKKRLVEVIMGVSAEAKKIEDATATQFFNEQKAKYRKDIAKLEVNGTKQTAIQKLAIFKKYMKDVAIEIREEYDVELNIAKLIYQSKQEQYEMEKVLLKQKVADNKLTEKEIFNEKLRWAERAKNAHPESSIEYQKNLLIEKNLTKQLNDFVVKDKTRVFEAKKSLRDLEMTQKGIEIDFLHASGQINAKEEISLRASVAEKKYALSKKLHEDILGIENLNSEEFKKIKDKQKIEQTRHNNEMLVLHNQYILEVNSKYKTLFDSMNSSFSNSIGNFIMGTEYWTETVNNLFKSLQQSFSRLISDMVKEWIIGNFSMESVTEFFTKKKVASNNKIIGSNHAVKISNVSVAGSNAAVGTTAASASVSMSMFSTIGSVLSEVMSGLSKLLPAVAKSISSAMVILGKGIATFIKSIGTAASSPEVLTGLEAISTVLTTLTTTLLSAAAAALSLSVGMFTTAITAPLVSMGVAMLSAALTAFTMVAPPAVIGMSGVATAMGVMAVPSTVLASTMPIIALSTAVMAVSSMVAALGLTLMGTAMAVLTPLSVLFAPFAVLMAAEFALMGIGAGIMAAAIAELSKHMIVLAVAAAAASVAIIPIIGGMLAPIAAFATGAAISAGVGVATSNLPSFEQGAMRIPNDMIASLHEDEIVMPKPFADAYRSNLKGQNNEQQGTGNNNYNITIQATDAKSFMNQIDNVTDRIAQNLNKKQRKFAY